MTDFEQGPIRPPSEAGSMLVRVSRNCSWNKCAFCPVYKGKKPSRRKVQEVIDDLDAMKEVYGDRPRTVFLQDANPLILRTRDLIQIVRAVRERFPQVERITTYARSRTLARRSLADLKALRDSGLDRLHVGLESGCDKVLDLVSKGVSRAEQIEAGQKAKAAGFELSEYVMPGLGGRDLSELHATDTASALAAISPDFIRLRTTAVIPRTPLADLEKHGRFQPCTELGLVEETRLFLEGLDDVETRLASDHILNLLMEIRGDLPEALPSFLSICDSLISLDREKRWTFILARRSGWMGSLETFLQPDVYQELSSQIQISGATDEELEELCARLRMRMV